MKYILLNEKQIRLLLSPSSSTLQSINNINNGVGKYETQLSRLKEIAKTHNTEKLQTAIDILVQKEKSRRNRIKNNSVYNVESASRSLSNKKFLIEKSYRKREIRIERLLSENEFDNYWFNLIKLSQNDKLNSKFIDHALEDKSGGVLYTQNLLGYRAFYIRRDDGFAKRLAKDKTEKSRAIICLYKRLDNGIIALCNIGFHDEVYNTSIEEYEFSEK